MSALITLGTAGDDRPARGLGCWRAGAWPKENAGSTHGGGRAARAGGLKLPAGGGVISVLLMELALTIMVLVLTVVIVSGTERKNNTVHYLWEDYMTIQKIFSFLIFPGKNTDPIPEINGTEVLFQLENYINHLRIYITDQDECIPIRFIPTVEEIQKNDMRDLIILL